MGRAPDLDWRQVYAVYSGEGMQGLTRTGEILGIPKWKVSDYRNRHNFDQMIVSEQQSLVPTALAAAKSNIALALAVSVQYLRDVVESPAELTKDRINAAKVILDRVPVALIGGDGGGGVRTITLVDARRMVATPSDISLPDLQRTAIDIMQQNILDVDEMRSVKR